MISTHVISKACAESDVLDVAILASIPLKSSAAKGVAAILFPEATFLKVVEVMLGDRHQQIDPQIADAASEILNMVYASARVGINVGGADFAPSIPMVTCGRDLRVHHPHGVEVERLSCVTDHGTFFFEWSLGGTS